MKHLKRHKIFESIDYNEIVNTIGDILVDLSDDGFETRVTTDFNKSEIGHFVSDDEVPENTIYLFVGKSKVVSDGHGGWASAPSEVFTFDDIKDVIFRMYKYVSSISMTTFGKIRFGYLDENEEFHTYRFDYSMLRRHFDLYYDGGMGYFEIAIMIEPKLRLRY